MAIEMIAHKKNGTKGAARHERVGTPVSELIEYIRRDTADLW